MGGGEGKEEGGGEGGRWSRRRWKERFHSIWYESWVITHHYLIYCHDVVYTPHQVAASNNHELVLVCTQCITCATSYIYQPPPTPGSNNHQHQGNNATLQPHNCRSPAGTQTNPSAHQPFNCASLILEPVTGLILLWNRHLCPPSSRHFRPHALYPHKNTMAAAGFAAQKLR